MHTKLVELTQFNVKLVAFGIYLWYFTFLMLLFWNYVVIATENQPLERGKAHSNVLDETIEKFHDERQSTTNDGNNEITTTRNSGTLDAKNGLVENTFVAKEESPQQQRINSFPESQRQNPTETTIHQESLQHIVEQQHPPKRNYASKECGAKILYSNEEAENKAAILNDPERDDYMRNPCERAQNKFLIIELCETIQPNSLEIANFELFSSSPKDFRLWGSERYPTQDWTLIGDFEAHDSREIQFFQIQQHALYAKFVKLELLTHYGKEHFCTLSTFRLYGISMVDEYEAAEAASATSNLLNLQSELEQEPTNHETTSSILQINSNATLSGEGNNDPHDYENNTGDTLSECSVTESSSEQILGDKSTVHQEGSKKRHQKIALLNHTEEFRRKKYDKKNDSSKIKIIGNEKINETDEQEERTVERHETTKFEEQQTEKSGNVLKTIVEIGVNLKHAIGQAFSHTKTDTVNNNNDNEKTSVKKSLSKNFTHGGFRTFHHQNTFRFCQLCPRDSPMRQCNMFCRIFFLSKTKRKLTEHNKLKLAQAKNARLDFLDRILRRQTATFCPLSSISTVCRRKNHEANVDRILIQNGQQKQSEQQKADQQVQSKINNENIAPNLQDGKGVKLQPQRPIITDKNNIRPLPGTTTTHKESVFMKLNKRLTWLEQSMSLSSEQLTELIKRCANNTQFGDEMLIRKHNEQMMTKMAERVAKEESHRVELEMKQQMNELQAEVNRLSQQLRAVTSAVQSTIGNNGMFFYRPFLTPIQGFGTSNVMLPHRYFDRNVCPKESELIHIAQEPLQHTSSSDYYANSVVINQSDGNTKDTLWTTKQVVILMILTQVLTFILFKLYRLLFDHLDCFQRTVWKRLSTTTMSPANTTNSIIDISCNINNQFS